MDKKNKNVPPLRFNGFEEEWEEKKFSTQAETSRGLTYSPYSLRKQGVRVLRSSNIDNDKFILSEDDVFVVEDAVNIEYAKNNDILITAANGSSRLVGKHCILRGLKSESSVHGGFMLLATAKQPFFLNASMSSSWYQKFISYYVAGGRGAIGNLNKADLDNQDVHIPSISEQWKIGSFFKELDDLIGAKEEELQKLRQLKSALLDAMFPNGDSENITVVNRGGQVLNNIIPNYPQLAVCSHSANTPRLRFRGFTAPWEKKKLSTECNFSKGRGYSKSDIQSSGIPLLLYGTMYTDYKTAINRTELYSSFKEGALLSNGYEVVVPASGETTEDIARASAIERSGIIIGGDLNVIYPNKSISPYFLALELTYGASHKHLTKKAQGISVVHLHNSDIQDLRITIPSLPEQQLISNFFRSQDENISANEQQISKLKTMKQACLQQMFV